MVSVSDQLYRHQNQIRVLDVSEKEVMGRRRMEIKRIENKSSRQVTFCKRRNSLMEKARQLSILCGSSVALFIVSSTGKLHSFSSGTDSMAKILGHYETQKAHDLRTLDLAEKTQDCLSHKELLEIVQCKLEETKSNNVSIDCLKYLEEQLKTALSIARARKTELMMELVKTLQDKEKLLIEENQDLASQMWKLKKLVETEDERAMSPENSSGNNPLETLPLLK